MSTSYDEKYFGHFFKGVLLIVRVFKRSFLIIKYFQREKLVLIYLKGVKTLVTKINYALHYGLFFFELFYIM